jgi:MYXO-CTERM domain-containing protein
VRHSSHLSSVLFFSVLSAFLLAGTAGAQPLAPGEIVVTNEVPSDQSENALLRVNPGTGASQPLARLELLRDPQRLAPAPDGGVYAAQSGTSVFHIDVESSAQTLITRSLQGITDIALAPTGDLLVLENSDRLLRLDTATGATTLESSLSALIGPNRIAIRSNLEVFVSDPATGRTYRVAGEVQTPIPTSRTFCFEAIAYEGSTDSLFGLECGAAIVWRIDPDTGQYEELTRDLWLLDCCASPPSMELAAGDLLVTTGDTVVRIDPATGAQELDLPAIQGPGFGDLAYGSGTSYFVRHGTNVLRFDPAPGVGTGGLISAVSVSPQFSPSEAPRSVAITPTGQVLVVIAQTLLKVDPATRAILVGPPSVADTFHPGALDADADGNALTAHFAQILLVEGGIGGVAEFATGNNLSSIRSIFREASDRVLALEGDEIVRVFADGPQSIVTRNQLFGSADVRDLAVVAGGDIFVTDGASTNLIRIDASNPNPDTNQSSLPGGADLASARGIATEYASTLLVAVNNPGCRGIARVTPSIPSTSCFGEGARFEAPFGVAVMAPEPDAAALAVAALGALALRSQRRRDWRRR